MPDDEASEQIAVGVISKPHGVRGEVRIHPYNADSDLLVGFKKVTLKPENGPARDVTIKASRGPKFYRARLGGVDSREAAEELRGTEVLVPRSELPEVEEGEFYLVDLHGLVVWCDGEEVGVVKDTVEYPSAACAVVQFRDGVREMPLLEQWIADIDLDAGKLHLHGFDDVPTR